MTMTMLTTTGRLMLPTCSRGDCIDVNMQEYRYPPGFQIGPHAGHQAMKVMHRSAPAVLMKVFLVLVPCCYTLVTLLRMILEIT